MSFELLYLDLWGATSCFPRLIYYYFIFYAFTRYTWIYVLKSKPDTLTLFKQFKNIVVIQFQSSIKVVQTDRGGEFRSFDKILAELGIVHHVIS